MLIRVIGVSIYILSLVNFKNGDLLNGNKLACPCGVVKVQVTGELSHNFGNLSLKACPHYTLKPVSPVSGTGSTRPHLNGFHWNWFHVKLPEG